MRIGIDAKWYFTGPVSTRVILQNLLPLLIDSNPHHHWFIFLDKRDQDKPFPLKRTNTSIVYIRVPNNMLSNIFILPRYARKLNLDMVVYQTFAGPGKTFKSIAFIHDVLFKDYSRFFTWKEKLYFIPLPYFTRRADRLITTTNAVANDLIKHRFARSRSVIDLVPLGVNSQFAPSGLHAPVVLDTIKAKYKLPDEFLLFVGRLNARKNIESLLKALTLLKNNSIPLVIAGKEDWKKPRIQQMLNNPLLANRIIMTGAIPDDELPGLFAMARIFCFPSFAEGFGLPPLEAMASGVPVIVSAATSLPEVCGEAALYIDPEKPDTIAHAIDELLVNKELYADLQQKGLQRAAGFTWPASAKKLMESINNAIKTAG